MKDAEIACEFKKINMNPATCDIPAAIVVGHVRGTTTTKGANLESIESCGHSK